MKLGRRRGHFIGAAIALTLPTACSDSPQIEECERSLQDSLKSPASYKRVGVSFSQIGPKIHNPPYDSVTIKYDAANSYNALLRDEYTCFYRPGTTEPIGNPFEKEVQEEMQRISDAALDASGNEIEAAGNAVEQATADTARDISTVESEESGETEPADTEREACLANAATSEDFDACNHGLPVDE